MRRIDTTNFEVFVVVSASPTDADTVKPEKVTAPALATFLKNDACPEITVKTLMAGQLHQGANVWEMMAFELIAKLAFDNFLALCDTIADLKRDVIFEGSNAKPQFDFATDDAVQRLERMAASMAA